jgi:hypothetical protein
MGRKQLVLMVFASLAMIGLLSALSQTALAGESISQTKNWEFNLAPFYIWGVALDGDVTVGTNTVPVELPFSDITDNLETAFIVHFEGMHKSNWGFLIDVNYLDLSSDVTLPGPFSVPGNVDFDATLAEFSALYRLPYEGYSFDLIAGLRYTKLENKLTLNTGPTLVDASQDWTDPLLGVRWKWGFADQWTLVARGDVGGFGIGSDFAVQGLALVDWQPFKYVSFLAGYRAIYQDYDDGSGPDRFRYDATMHGPVLGVNFRW